MLVVPLQMTENFSKYYAGQNDERESLIVPLLVFVGI